MATTKKAKPAAAKRKPAAVKTVTPKKATNKVEAKNAELLVYIFTALSIVFLIVAILQAA